MQLNPLQLVTQFAHILQLELFPKLEGEVGPLSKELELLTAVASMAPLERMLSANRASTGRPAKDRTALATAFMAKAVLNLPTTRDLISRLRVDAALRRFCGWYSAQALPHESKFSRAFAEFAATELPQKLHAAIIEATQRQRLIGHITRDSTAIPARESLSEAVKQERKAELEKARKKKKAKEERKRAAKRAAAKQTRTAEKSKRRTRPAAKRKHPKGAFAKAKATNRGKRIQRQRHQKLEEMIDGLPRHCDYGAKKNSQGNENYWRGYKLHLDVADGQLPISAVLTSASVHDSQVAIPLMTLTSKSVAYLYEVMDSAYDADDIHAHSRQLNHEPIIAPHPRRGTKKSSEVPKVHPDKPARQLDWAKQERYKVRTMSERVNARLKDEFGASQIRVRGAAKVMAHLMFGVIALTVDQWLRMSLPLS
ncbi:MAG: transposase [Terrimicrobiaceae bacterium]